MRIKIFSYELSVCQLKTLEQIDFNQEFFFIGKTDEEISLVCLSENVPAEVLKQEAGWKCFKIEGILDFSLVGILSKIANLLAEHQISIFAVSTYNTDYVLVKNESFEKAIAVLAEAGYLIEE